MPRTRAILARTNVRLLTAVEAAWDAGERPAVAGGVAPLVALLRAVAALQAGRPARHPDLAGFHTWEELVAAAETPLGAAWAPLVRLVAQRGRAVAPLARRLETACVPPAQATVLLSTAHRAKGGEWDHVRLLDDFRWPRHAGEREEAHLLYVACTRARHTLDTTAAAALRAVGPVPPAPDAAASRPR